MGPRTAFGGRFEGCAGKVFGEGVRGARGVEALTGRPGLSRLGRYGA